MLRLNPWAQQLALEGAGRSNRNPFGLRAPALLSSTAVNSPQSLVAFAALSLCQPSLFCAPTTLFALLFPLFSVHWSLLLLSAWFLRSPLLTPHICTQAHPSSPLSLHVGWGSTGRARACCQPLRTLFLPCNAGSSGRKGSTADKEPVCQPGTERLQQTGVWPARACRGPHW